VPLRPVAFPAVLFAAALLGALPARPARAQFLSLNGYVRDSPILWKEPEAFAAGSGAGEQRFTNLLHTRQNLRLFPAAGATVGLEVKTRLFAGDAARELADRTDLTASGRTYFAWQRRFVEEPRTVLACALDRAWLSVERGPVQATIGRQRIAWGTALVWNPIDVVNPSSPLDFDDVEKPGADAVRTQVYLGPASKVDVAAVPARRADDAVLLGELVLNRAGVDWVAMGGRRGPWAVVGGAWAGDIRGGGFRGEFLVSVPRSGLRAPDSGAVERTNLVACVDGDFTFPSSLYLHAAALYNRRGSRGDAGGARLLEAYGRGWPSPARWSLYAEAARDLGPLLRADLAGILDAGDRSGYLGPTLTWSAATDLDVAATAFLFAGAPGTEFGDEGHLLMARLQWSF